MNYKIQHFYAYGAVEGPAVRIYNMDGGLIVGGTEALIDGTKISFDSDKGYAPCGKSEHLRSALEAYFKAAKSAWLDGKSAIFIN